MKLGEFLKVSREKAGLSQLEVAKKFGYSSPQFVSNWERNLSYPPISQVKDLVKLYRLDIDMVYKLILEQKVEEIRTDLQRKLYSNLSKEKKPAKKKTKKTTKSFVARQL